MDNDLKYHLKFYGSATPFIVTKIRPTTARSKIREGVGMISSMAGYIQVYYVEKLGLELTKQNMSASIFLTTVAQMFKNEITKLISSEEEMTESISDKNDVWVLHNHN